MRARVLLAASVLIALSALLWPGRDDPHARSDAAREAPGERPTEPFAADAGPDAPAPSVIRGRVVEKGTGEPIAGARVLVDDRDVLRTDADGRFELVHRALSEHARFEISHARHETLQALRPLDEGRLEFRLTAGLPIGGRIVMAESKRPVPGIPVSVGNFRTITDETGRFSTGGHQPGKVWVSCHSMSAEIRAGEENVELGIAGPLLVVHTQDEGGAPLRGVRVDNCRWVFGEVWADYLIVGIDRKQGVRGVARKEGYLPASIEFAGVRGAADLYETTVQLRKRPPYALLLDVCYTDGTRPQTVTATLEGAPGSIPISQKLEAVDGAWMMSGVPAGPFSLRVVGDRNYLLPFETDVAIRPTLDNRREIRLPLGGLLRVRWKKYASRYYLEVRHPDLHAGRYRLGKVGDKPVWGPESRLPFGRYQLVELRGADVLRKAEVEVRSAELVLVDWTED